MPTGYTAQIKEGYTFEEYAINTLKAFGVCVMLRESDDLPNIDNIKDKSSHHQDALDEIKGFDKQAYLDDYDSHKSNRIKGAKEGIARNKELEKQYRIMLEKVELFTCPSSEHEGWVKFMKDQIQDSIKADCGGRFYEDELDRLNNMTEESYLAEKINSHKWSIDYHTDKLNKQESSNKSRQEFIGLALKAIKEV